jgi:hypothetical protein
MIATPFFDGFSGGFLSRLTVLFLVVSITNAPVSFAADKDRGAVPVTSASVSAWGTYLKPFSANSPWNSRPIRPVLDAYVIPKSDFYPLVGAGKYSLEVFLAKVSDGPAIVYGPPGAKGVWDPDSEIFRESISIPRWPAEVVPAAGSDGHADIVDPVTGIVHSFHKLRSEGGRWVASQYAWSRIDGRGWGDPAHYFQGARAAGVPSMGGLIRKHEVNDGDTLYRHALAVSLTFNALSPKPVYVFPATSGDGSAPNTNSGAIPEGALLMLPELFNVEQVSDPALRKVVETLKVYGAYVVDRNGGTPFYIYAENGSDLNLHRGGWNNVAAADLDRIRQALRQVTSTSGWLDGNGHRTVLDKNLNLLSMRGPWIIASGTRPGTFDTWEQAVVFPETTSRTVQMASSSRSMNAISWAVPKPEANYRLSVVATGGASLRFQLRDNANHAMVYDSKELKNGENTTFSWPQNPASLLLFALSGIGPGSTVRGELVEIEK